MKRAVRSIPVLFKMCKRFWFITHPSVLIHSLTAERAEAAGLFLL